MLIQVDKATDARDKPIHLMAERLVGPPELRFDFERVLESVLQSGSDTNNVNAVNNMGAIRDGYMTSVYLN